MLTFTFSIMHSLKRWQESYKYVCYVKVVPAKCNRFRICIIKLKVITDL